MHIFWLNWWYFSEYFSSFADIGRGCWFFDSSCAVSCPFNCRGISSFHILSPLECCSIFVSLLFSLIGHLCVCALPKSSLVNHTRSLWCCWLWEVSLEDLLSLIYYMFHRVLTYLSISHTIICSLCLKLREYYIACGHKMRWKFILLIL